MLIANDIKEFAHSRYGFNVDFKQVNPKLAEIKIYE